MLCQIFPKIIADGTANFEKKAELIKNAFKVTLWSLKLDGSEDHIYGTFSGKI